MGSDIVLLPPVSTVCLVIFCQSDTVISAMSVRMAIFADTINTPARHAEMHSENPFSSNPLQPHAPIVAPVFDSFDRSTRKHVGNLIGLFTMETFLVNLVPERIRGIYLVVENTCSQTFTFKIDGNRVSQLKESVAVGRTFCSSLCS
jgi:hypothetical protein